MPIANRNRVETERLIGFFVNTQVLKADLDGRMGFDELLAQARQRALEAQAHQDLPFEQLVDISPIPVICSGNLEERISNRISVGNTGHSGETEISVRRTMPTSFDSTSSWAIRSARQKGRSCGHRPFTAVTGVRVP